MPVAMGSPGLSQAFYYGPEHQRIKQISSSQGTTYYLNPGNNGDLLYEKDIKPDNSTEQRNYITAYGQVVAVVKLTNGVWSTRYMHRDNLGSVTAITNETGTVIERLAYEPFGKRRFANGSTDPNNTILPQNTDRGFTNHEHLDELTLIHMNGRVYDPVAGRFMSADPHIQDPMNLQSYNRYAYVMNNPLGYTDPSGYFRVGKLFAALFAPVTNKEVFRMAVTIAAAYYVGNVWAPFGSSSGSFLASVGNGAAGGFAGGFVGSGGNFNAGLNGAFSGGLFGAIGYQGDIGKWGDFAKVAAHAGAGCATSSVGGGDCGSGALSAGFGKFATLNMPNAFKGDTGYELTYVTVVGGTASVLGGGKFGNGAMTAAYGYLFNHLFTVGVNIRVPFVGGGRIAGGVSYENGKWDAGVIEDSDIPVLGMNKSLAKTTVDIGYQSGDFISNDKRLSTNLQVGWGGIGGSIQGDAKGGISGGAVTIYGVQYGASVSAQQTRTIFSVRQVLDKVKVWFGN